jgi:hypothetical protein
VNNDLMTVPAGELDVMTLGDVLARSGYFADANQAAQAVVKVLAGRELGFGPIASMTGIHIVKGRPTIGADLLAKAVKRSGRYDYRVAELSDTGCTIKFFERDGDGWREIGTSTFTIQDARRAGTGNLDKFPRNMLFARAMSNGVKWYCPDAVGLTVYDPSELPDDGPALTLVNTTTGEITQAPPPDNGHGEPPPNTPPPASRSTLNVLHTLGVQLYGKDWDAKRADLVKAVSKGAVTSSNDLTQKEAQALIDGMRAKLDAKPHVADPMLDSINKLPPAPGAGVAQATAELFGDDTPF